MTASVLVAAYKRPSLLSRTLLGLCRQSTEDFDVVICEDDRDPEIEQLVHRFESRLGRRLAHVSQEDRGFRKCRILNEGIRRGACEYLIFLDGDCIPHHHFVEGHLRSRRKGTFLSGHRVMLGEEITRNLTDANVLSGRLESLLAFGLPALLRGQLRHLDSAIRLPDWLPTWLRPGNPRLRGCNFSCWKSDLYRINGFNEAFVGPGIGEDSDIHRRFRLIGLKGISVKNMAICFHQSHRRVPRSKEAQAFYSQLRDDPNPRCQCGLEPWREPGKAELGSASF